MKQVARLGLIGYFVLVFPFSISVIAQLRPSEQSPKPGALTVPFIGCDADGQLGPVKAPQGQEKIVSVSPEVAGRLAFYSAANGLGVLAPRGWNCFSTYGSNGSSLFVVPTAINPRCFFSPEWNGFNGPAVEISLAFGGTSGRFTVAKVIARVFPGYSDFLKAVIAEGIEPASSFPSGPYPNDKLSYRGKRIVEFQTPANSDGLGTHSRLTKAASPINGVAILVGSEPNLLQLSMRLTPETHDLAGFIVHHVEHDAGRTNK